MPSKQVRNWVFTQHVDYIQDAFNYVGRLESYHLEEDSSLRYFICQVEESKVGGLHLQVLPLCVWFWLAGFVL